MKTVYIKNMFLMVLKRKRIIGFSVICFFVLFGVLGFRNYMKASNGYTEEQRKELEEYEEILGGYDDSITELETSIIAAQEQVDLLKEYCDNSLYMRLDPQNVQTVTVQYGIQTNGNVSYILSAFVSYINEGSLKDKLSEKLNDVSTEYLKEIITCSTNGNILVISVMHYDMEQAQTIMNLIEQEIQAQSTQIAGVQGEFVLSKLDSSNYARADINVMNSQNTNLNNYKNNESSLSGLKSSLSDRKNSRKTFVENNEPDISEPERSISMIFKYLLFGIILGAGLPIVIFGLQYVMSDRLKGRGDLLAADIAVLGSYKNNEGYIPQIERSLMDIQLLADEKTTTSIFLNILGESEVLKKIREEYTEKLERHKLGVWHGSAVQENAEELKQMMQAGNCILIAESGNTTYTQLEEQIQLCHKFHIDIWGCIIVE